jgi:hypothetical protein
MLGPGKLEDGPPTCGGQLLAATVDAPVLYFVFDRSGSMSDPIASGGPSKYEAALDAIEVVLRSIGHRVRYGAAVYPSDGDAPSCIPGAEVFPPTQGDAPSRVVEGQDGIILSTFMQRIEAHPPDGATPTSSTLLVVARNLAKVKTRAYVVLVTDGAPNCNAAAACTSADCIPDIERVWLGDERCGDDGLSCCDTQFGAEAGANCVDGDASVAAVQNLAARGVDTYVVGMPGSEAYRNVLERLAVAGNTARDAAPGYFAVTDTDALTNALFEIGTGLSIGCDIALEAAPADPSLVNVYFDAELVVQDPNEGWDYGESGALAIHGSACTALKSGEVRQVKVTYGCETIVR